MSDEIFKKGYTILDFRNTICITAIQEEIKKVFSSPIELHYQKLLDDQRLNMIKQARDLILEKNLVKKLLLDNIDSLTAFMGLDIDIQSGIYLRVSRPNHESDFIDWHRDTFYGNSQWELNFWFPVFPLEKGAGLMVVEGSHLLPMANVRYVEEKNEFRKQVTKGSLASILGYQYAPKSEDSISDMDLSSVKLLAPKVGQAVFFFGHLIHRAQNCSTKMRVSIDVRVKHMLASTSTKSGYYEPLTRSAMTNCIEKMESIEKGALCGN